MRVENCPQNYPLNAANMPSAADARAELDLLRIRQTWAGSTAGSYRRVNGYYDAFCLARGFKDGLVTTSRAIEFISDRFVSFAERKGYHMSASVRML